VGIAACATTLSVGCASNLSLKVGWDEHADFSKFHTWLWKPDGSIQDPIWARRCQDVLSDELAKHALQQVSAPAQPDLWAVVHARLSSQTQVVSFAPDWGYGWGAYGAAWAYDDTVEYEVPLGTMVIDLVDARKKEIVWRGRAKDVISPDKTNEQREEKLISVLQQLFTGFPPATKTASAAIPVR